MISNFYNMYDLQLFCLERQPTMWSELEQQSSLSEESSSTIAQGVAFPSIQAVLLPKKSASAKE